MISQIFEALQPAIAFFGVLGFSVSVVVGSSWAAFQWFGKKWIENKFSKTMEQYRAEQAQELERLKHRINSTFDRVTRLHDREFEVLPDLWGKLVEARMWTRAYASSFQSYPSIEFLDEYALAEFLKGQPFAEWQKREIAAAANRQEQFIKTLNRYRHSDVNAKIREFERSFAKNGIFLTGELENMMGKLVNILNSAVIEQNINEEHDTRPRMRDAKTALDKEGTPLFEAIKKVVTERLWESANREI